VFLGLTPTIFGVFIDSQIEKEKQDFYIENKRFGTLCAVIAGLFSKKKFKASDFFPIKEKAKKQQTVEDMALALKLWTRSLGGEVIG